MTVSEKYVRSERFASWCCRSEKRLAACVCRFEVGPGGLVDEVGGLVDEVVFCSSCSNSPPAAHPSFRQRANPPLASHYSRMH